MANYVYIAASLDGYIATQDGGIDWLMEIPNPEKSDYGYAEFMQGIDALVMGRNTFEKVLTFGEWPYEKPVFVLSEHLTRVPETHKDKAEILKGDPKELTEGLKERGFTNLYIDGGKVIQSFLKEDLIDELIVTHIPVLLGGGIPLFGELDQMLKLEHVKTEVFLNALVQSWYKRVKTEGCHSNDEKI